MRRDTDASLFEYLAQLIIRPTRHLYPLENLGKLIFNIGPRKMMFSGENSGRPITVVRKDFTLLNNRNNKLQASLYEIKDGQE